VPIRDEGGSVIAVTQMINKRHGTAFREQDKQLLKAFAAFAAKSIATVQKSSGSRAIRGSGLDGEPPLPLKSFAVNPDYLPTDNDREAVKSWGFDVWKYNHTGLIRCIVALFETFNLIKIFAIPIDRLIHFLKDLAGTYRDVPYHNFYHAVDVTQALFVYLYHGQKTLQDIFSPLEMFAILVASLCHDADHGGLNNAYHVKAQTPLALLYKDMSVLETHHCSKAISLLSETENDILASLDEAQHGTVWKLLISTILATDMSLHFTIVGQFEALIKGKKFDKTCFEDRKLLASMIMKCADISNVVRPFRIAKHWAEILSDEFFNQGDMERMKGLAVSPLMDRNNVIMPQMQLGFINSICVPIFSLLVAFCPDLQPAMVNIKDNLAEWSRILQKGMEDSQPSQTTNS
jgi:hypothetical protein